MTRLFIDTNILVDLIPEQDPFSIHAIKIFGKAEARKAELFISSYSLAASHYMPKYALHFY
ncbi:MAG TPA: hypothetical protein VK907_12400 [Phnomibacter sp.]|nr:hypothetical protein [Phnomibacter sp.]